jgi:hypothetical protein
MGVWELLGAALEVMKVVLACFGISINVNPGL